MSVGKALQTNQVHSLCFPKEGRVFTCPGSGRDLWLLYRPSEGEGEQLPLAWPQGKPSALSLGAGVSPSIEGQALREGGFKQPGHCN